MKKKIFLICPVRSKKNNLIKRFFIRFGVISDKYQKEQEKIRKHVENLEKMGHKVHWPKRDTDQNDPIGLRICTDNARAIIWADEIHVWWKPDSSGSKFDIGMSFMCSFFVLKKIILANPEEVKSTDYKSFENVLLALEGSNKNK